MEISIFFMQDIMQKFFNLHMKFIFDWLRLKTINNVHISIKFNLRNR